MSHTNYIRCKRYCTRVNCTDAVDEAGANLWRQSCLALPNFGRAAQLSVFLPYSRGAVFMFNFARRTIQILIDG